MVGTPVRKAYELTGRVAVITGGAGLLGMQHAAAIAELGGIPVLLDLSKDAVEQRAQALSGEFGVRALGLSCNICSTEQVNRARVCTLEAFGRIDILINNAANNPQVEGQQDWFKPWSRLESFPLDVWQQDLAVGLTGAFLCSRAFGGEMARRGCGVILNIASDLALIGPDQRIYRKPGLPEVQQPAKPVTYSVVKAGLLGLTRYLATYWADRGVRVNALCPGGVFNHQNPAFVRKLSKLIPLGRMARLDEYRAAVVFLVSDASSYMTGAVLSVDGGRTAW